MCILVLKEIFLPKRRDGGKFFPLKAGEARAINVSGKGAEHLSVFDRTGKSCASALCDVAKSDRAMGRVQGIPGGSERLVCVLSGVVMFKKIIWGEKRSH